MLTHREYIKQREQLKKAIIDLSEDTPLYVVTIMEYNNLTGSYKLHTFTAGVSCPDVSINEDHLVDLEVGQFWCYPNAISYVRIK